MANLDSINNIVRVMDFHALARIDKARSSAEKAKETEILLENSIRQICYNKNLNIDKKLLTSNMSGVDLNIYIGSDLSFCGDFNSSILGELENDSNDKKIIVGQKVYSVYGKETLLSISKEDFYIDSSQISKIINDYLVDNKVRKISIIYNKYYSIDDIRLEREQIFPVELEMQKDDNYDVDFVIENDANKVLCGIISAYLNFKVIIAERNSWAAENVSRERIARESLKRIKELRLIEKSRRNKIRRSRELAKQIENFKMLHWRKSL